jgi:hypothetical protein
MNKFFSGLLLWAVLVQSAACHRRQLPGSTPSPASASVSKPDTIASRPTSTSIAVSKADTANTAKPARPGIEEARANVAEIDFRYLTAKSKLSFKSKEQDINNASVTIRVRKDSLIWLTVSKVGIEAVRALISRDSITIMDKIHGTYTQYDFPSLSRRFNFNMDFALLQALIVGNLPLPKRPAQKIRNERDYLLLRQTEGKVLVENYIGTEDRKLKKLMLTEQPTKNTLSLDYDEFAALNDFVFPFASLITLNQAGPDGQFYQTLLRIKHSKVELVDKNPGFPFTIPARYERKP